VRRTCAGSASVGQPQARRTAPAPGREWIVHALALGTHTTDEEHTT
jgi:hypothetical protein